MKKNENKELLIDIENLNHIELLDVLENSIEL